MEEARSEEWSCPERATEEEECKMSCQLNASNAKSAAKGTKRKKAVKNDKDPKLKEEAQDKEPPKPRKKIPIPPLPAILPPINLIHRDVLRGWCQQLRLSSKGQKVDVYKRLCEYAFPKQKSYLLNIPESSKEARMKVSPRKPKVATPLDSSEQQLYSEGTVPLELAPVHEEHVATLDEPPGLFEEVSTTVVTTTAPEAVLASWARIASSAGRMEEVKAEGPAEVYADRWCVVHGRSLPVDSEGWVRLQFQAGQAWVPGKKGQVSALFLLPACTFPPPHLEDNMLCPKCVHRNKILTKSLQ